MERIFSSSDETWHSSRTINTVFKELESFNDLEEGVSIFTGFSEIPDPSKHIISADDILERYEEAVYENEGEWSEDRTGADTVIEEAKAELNAYLKQWANTYITPTYFNVLDSIEEIPVTQIMIDAFHSGKPIPLKEFKFSLPECTQLEFIPNVHTQTRIIKWFENGETGKSAECLAYTIGLQQIGKLTDAPGDQFDFFHCLKLLEAVPELRSGLHIMRRVSKTWELIIDKWDYLETTFLNEIGSLSQKQWKAPKTFENLNAIRYEAYHAKP